MSILYIRWNVDPMIFDGFPFGYYNLLFVGGIFLCANVVKKIFDEEKIAESSFLTLFYYCLGGIVIGARLGHCLFYEPDYYLSHPLDIILPFRIEEGQFVLTGYRGLASHGGTLGLLIAIFLFSRKSKIGVVKVLDYIAIAAPLGAFCIRLGNLMNSEIIGKVTYVPWAFVFERVDLLPRHPAQLYEAMAYFVLFLLMIYIYKRQKKVKKTKDGLFFGSVLTLIFLFRFFVEFLKERQVDFEDTMPLDMGQLLSIPFILIGCFFIFFYKQKISS
jgi:prolipoprotein diacylglyceryl transferase